MSNETIPTQPKEAETINENNTTEKQTAKNKKNIVSKIMKDRRKHGEEQLLVVYSHEKGDKGHWVPRASLDCHELIDEYFVQKSKNKPEGNKKFQTRQIAEICGIIPKDGKIYSFEVLFKDSSKKEFVSVQNMHKHYAKQLINFYEAHIEPMKVKEIDAPNTSSNDTDKEAPNNEESS